jgi:exodeoxyribonuclease III
MQASVEHMWAARQSALLRQVGLSLVPPHLRESSRGSEISAGNSTGRGVLDRALPLVCCMLAPERSSGRVLARGESARAPARDPPGDLTFRRTWKPARYYGADMRIATWNVNSLKARLEKVQWWLDRARPDVLLMQETKLRDADAPVAAFGAVGYELAHHGEGRWNGVAIASRHKIESVVTNFGEPLRAERTPEVGDDEPLAEARMIAATCGGVRVVSVYAPNGRAVGSVFYEAKLLWFKRLWRWLEDKAGPAEPWVVGGDFNVAPNDVDVWDPQACHGGTHVSPREREAFSRLLQWGLLDVYRQHHPEPGRYSWWDYRAGDFHRNIGMRIDHLLATRPVSERTVWAEIDREARKGKPTPSDHAPVVMDVDQPGQPLDAGWAGADQRVARRRV